MKNCSITSKNVISSNCFPDINVSIYKNPCDSLPLDSNKIGGKKHSSKKILSKKSISKIKSLSKKNAMSKKKKYNKKKKYYKK